MLHVPSLWFDDAGVAAVRERRRSGHQLTARILKRCHDQRDPASKERVGALAAMALAEGDVDAAKRLADHLLASAAYPQDLGLAHRSLQLAIAHECCAGLWDEARLQGIRQAAGALVDQLRHGTSSQNPHAVQNNWWAVTHGGVLLAALIAGRSSEARWALGRCLAFSQHFGPTGLYHEGLGYQMYTLSHLLPALCAAHRLGLVDLAAECPWLGRMAESLYAFTAPRPAVSDNTAPAEGSGMMLSWNDAGLSWSSGIVSPLMLAHADPQRRAALAAWSLRLEAGHGEEAPLYAGWEGWPIALALPPDAWCAAPSTTGLRRHVCDPRQGLAVFRDRWQDGDDTVLGCYARSTHVGGHAQDDGGSIRLMALGHDWIIGGGQARGEAAWQSVLTPDDAGKRKVSCGAVMWDEATANGGVFAMDLRRVSGAYHERYVALTDNGSMGVPTALAMLDLVDDHLERAWAWRITHAPDLDCTLDADGAGFILSAIDGPQARFRFLGQRPEALNREKTPVSQRTFSNGVSVTYPARPVVTARFSARKHLAVHVAVAIARSTPPELTSNGGVDIGIGDRIWRQPYSDAVPAGYDLLRAGTLARWADGQRGA